MFSHFLLVNYFCELWQLQVLFSSDVSFPFHIHPLFLYLLPRFISPRSPSAPSRCVNQDSLLTHDSPHMSSTAPGLNGGAEIVSVCVYTSAFNTGVSLFLFQPYLLCMCVHVCAKWVRVQGRVCLKIHQLFSKGLLLSPQICLLSPWVSTLIHLCIWVHVVCVSACVCKHANPGEGPA